MIYYYMSYNNSPLTPTFTPFRSGCGMCKPSTDYYNVQTGSGNYSKDGLIPESNGKNFYQEKNFQLPLDGKFIKDNFGIDYATSFGGKKTKLKKSATSKSKKSSTLKVKSKKSAISKKSLKGGFNDSITESMPNTMSNSQSMGTMINSESMGTMINSEMSGGKKTKLTISKKSLKGGLNHSMTASMPNTMLNSKNMGTMINSESMGTMINSEMSGGVKKLAISKKSLKGGLNHSMTASMPNTMLNTQNTMLNTMINSESMGTMINSEMSGGVKKSAISKKSLKGGLNHSMTASMPNTMLNTQNMGTMINSEMSGGVKKNSKKSQKGSSLVNPSLGPSPVHTHQVKVNNLPYISQKSLNREINGGVKKNSKKIQKGGLSKSKSMVKNMKGGQESSGATPMDQRFYNPQATLENYPANSGNGVMSAYGPIQVGDIGSGMLAPYTSSNCSSANHNTNMKTGGVKKNMKGGQESSGATPMDQRFYNPQATLENYPPNSGNGVMSAYGPIQVGDIGSGMLAPYTSSNCSTANHNTNMKTGGVKKNKKINLKGAGGPIPKISDSPVRQIQHTVTGAIDKFTRFMETLDQDYDKSIDYIKSIKIGNQRLIQGGKKTSKPKTSKPKTSKPKTSKSKTSTSKPKSKKGGFDGSDFASTLNSRGPWGVPDSFWGVPGETWFRQFNKTGDYIPNSQLPYAATPSLAGTNPSGVVTGYDESDLNYIQM